MNRQQPRYNFLTLGNGLRVVHCEDKATSMVALSVLYDTGARDENPGHTGLAHLMEHLMFAGSVNAPDFDKALQKAGGINNAWTSNDFTCFYEVVPAHNAETLFWLESDRMMGLSFSETSLEIQKKVVVQEFYQQCINRPYGKLNHAVRALAYKRHPYRWPVIGIEPSHIEKTALPDIKSYYENHYSPSNAIIAVVGGISFGKTSNYMEKWFSSIPVRDIKPRELPEEPLPEEPRQKTVIDAVPNALVSINFPMDKYGTEAYYIADLISDILSSGRSSVFYRELVSGTRLFDSVDASITGSEDPGLFNITALLRAGADVYEAKKHIDNILTRIKQERVAEKDRLRALNRMESARIFENIGPLQKSQNLALACYHDIMPDCLDSIYRSITPGEIREESCDLFDPDRETTIFYLPKD